MSYYPDSSALLADVDLRLDRFGDAFGVLVVEGPDDKRFMINRPVYKQQVIAAGGRRILLSARFAAEELGKSSVAFLTDCDYEVTEGILTPADNLVITKFAALESDLLENDGFDSIVVELVAAALHDDEIARTTAAAVRARAVALADIIGRVRRVAKRHSFPLELGSLRYSKYRNAGTDNVEEGKLIRAIMQASRDATLSADEVERLVGEIPSAFENCHGHDLVSATHHVLRADFGVRDQTDKAVSMILRNSVDSARFNSLHIAARLRQWEQKTGRQLFRI